MHRSTATAVAHLPAPLDEQAHAHPHAEHASHGGALRFVGPALSIACLVHCIGFAALAPLLPGALALWGSSPLVEAVLWLTSVALSVFIVVQAARAGHPVRWWGSWGVGVAFGAAGLALGVEPLIQASLVLIAGVQIAALVRRWRVHHASHAHTDCNPEC